MNNVWNEIVVFRVPRDEEYLLLDLLYRLVRYFKDINVNLNLDDMTMFTKTFLVGFEWESEFAKVMHEQGFLCLKLSPHLAKTQIIDRGDVFDYLLLSGNKRWGVECKSRHDPLLISKARVERQSWLVEALNLDDLLIAWRAKSRWFLFSYSLLSPKLETNLGLSETQLLENVKRENEDYQLRTNFNPDGYVKAAGLLLNGTAKLMPLSIFAKENPTTGRARCMICGRVADIFSCKTCGMEICMDDAIFCEVEEEVYCKNCAKPVTCRKCGKEGCNHCVTSQEICEWCL
nr:hypothetical protein [Candidatus Njordarchaeum guaymaensis]